eukprot:5423618-Pleurochrysis_carterae.AAC.3
MRPRCDSRLAQTIILSYDGRSSAMLGSSAQQQKHKLDAHAGCHASVARRLALMCDCAAAFARARAPA